VNTSSQLVILVTNLPSVTQL